MFGLLFEALLRTCPQLLGHGVVFAVTLGRVRCEDGVAQVVGGALLFLLFAVLVGLGAGRF